MATHDAEPPWWTPRKTTPPRRALSREAIVAAALEILRTEGADAVSMRHVATALGTGPASLYAHVANKDELLDLLYNELLAVVQLETPDATRWREQSVRLWTDVRAALTSGGDLARYSLGRVPMGPHSLRIAEQFMAILRLGGVPDHAVARAIEEVGAYVAASALDDAVTAELERAGRDADAYYDGIHRYFNSLPAQQFPTIAALAAQMTVGDGNERFRFGLDVLLGGLAALATASSPVASSPVASSSVAPPPPAASPGTPATEARPPAGPSAARRATVRRRNARNGA